MAQIVLSRFVPVHGRSQDEAEGRVAFRSETRPPQSMLVLFSGLGQRGHYSIRGQRGGYYPLPTLFNPRRTINSIAALFLGS